MVGATPYISGYVCGINCSQQAPRPLSPGRVFRWPRRRRRALESAFFRESLFCRRQALALYQLRHLSSKRSDEVNPNLTPPGVPALVVYTGNTGFGIILAPRRPPYARLQSLDPIKTGHTYVFVSTKQV